MELSDGCSLPNLVRNCRWTIVSDRHSRNVSTQNAFSLPFAAILVNCAPSGETHNYCTPHTIKENFENFLIHWCNYILLYQVYCVWQVVKTTTIISKNPVYCDNLFVITLLLLEPDDTVLVHIHKKERTDSLPLTCYLHRVWDVVTYLFSNTAEVLTFKGLFLILINYILLTTFQRFRMRIRNFSKYFHCSAGTWLHNHGYCTCL